MFNFQNKVKFSFLWAHTRACFNESGHGVFPEIVRADTRSHIFMHIYTK